MSEARAFAEGADETQEAIMQATYAALCKHGYADLTIQRIADEFPKSKSLLYHHYGGKDELLLDFLECMLDWFEDRIPVRPDVGAEDRLSAILDYWFAAALPDEYRDFTRAIVELRAQAAHDPAYRAHFTRSDRFFRDYIVRVIRDGIEEGVFRDVDPERAATYLQTLIIGVMTQRVTTDEDENVVKMVRTEYGSYVETCLRSPEASG